MGYLGGGSGGDRNGGGYEIAGGTLEVLCLMIMSISIISTLFFYCVRGSSEDKRRNSGRGGGSGGGSDGGGGSGDGGGCGCGGGCGGGGCGGCGG